MNTVINSLLFAHVAAGFAALALFWVPIFVRKGGLNHRRVGNWYVQCMWVVSVSALMLSVRNLVLGNLVMGCFLGFLSLLTARPLWLGIESLSCKKGMTQKYWYAHLVTSVLLALAGVGLIWFGVSLNGKGPAPLMFVFGGLGLLALKDIADVLKHGKERGFQLWLDEHIVNMCGTGIAAHTAFLAFGANRVMSESFTSVLGIVAWIAPTVIGVVGIRVAKHRFVKPKSVS